MAINSLKRLALLGSVAIGLALPARAQDSGPLLDLLVKKGIVNDQEAEDIRAALVKDFAANTSAGKLNLSPALTEFALSGDMRLREQFETQRTIAVPGTASVANERERVRLRFRLNGDLKLQSGWGAGFSLQTAQNADSANQTLDNIGTNYGIYLARAYVSYQPSLNWFFTGGKFKNPFFTTDLVWDADINPQGFAETHTTFLNGKDTFEVRAGQLVMKDNAEAIAAGAAPTTGVDAWLFDQQLVYTKWFGAENLSDVLFAPGFMFYNASTITSQVSGTNKEQAYNGSTKYLKIVTLPGEVNFANIYGTGTQLKTYWDFTYNTAANDRAHQSVANGGYGLPATTNKGAMSWLVGLGYGYGQGKNKGDYSLKADYRQTGISALDPNITDSDFAFNRLNQKGYKFSGSYNLTDFASLTVTYFITSRLNDSINTKAPALAADPTLSDLNSTNTLQVDLNVKF